MATIKDVARVSGVSIATVSQVLSNGGRPVSPTTRERVVRAAQQLDYRPNALARALLSKRLNTVGLVLQHDHLSSPSDPFPAAVLDGVLSVNTRREQTTALYTISRWDDTAGHLSRICDGRCDGVILVAPPDCALPAALSQAGLPYVLAAGRDARAQAASVDIDHADAAAGMTEYLLRLGHRRIAFVSPRIESPSVRARHRGCRRTMEAWAACGAALTDLAGEDAPGAAGSGPTRPTAFFCADDSDALALIGRFSEHGLRVPEDVSVVGFGDVPGAALSRPALTTVRPPTVRVGERAAEMLLALIEGAGPTWREETVATELAIRQSAAPPSG